jgi:hypothetical protein
MLIIWTRCPRGYWLNDGLHACHKRQGERQLPIDEVLQVAGHGEIVQRKTPQDEEYKVRGMEEIFEKFP